MSPRGSSLSITDPDWTGGSNDIFGNDAYGNLNISGGVNTIHGDEGTGLGAGSLTIGPGDIVFMGNSSPSIIVSADHTTSGSLTLNSNVGFTGTAGTAAIVSGPALLSDGVTVDPNQTGLTPGTLSLNGTARTFTINDGTAAVDMTISASIIGNSSSALIKAGAGTLQLTGTNTFAGNTTIDGGTLQISSDANLGAVPGGVTANKLVLNGGGILQATSSFTLHSNRGVTLGAGGGVLNVGGSNVLTYNGSISGAGNPLTKTGTGGVVLGGTNTAGAVSIGQGSFTVSSGASLATSSVDVQGSLLVNNGTITGGTTVGNAGIVMGNGTFSGGTFVVNNNATVSPGNSPGHLTTGPTTWSPTVNATYVWEINQLAGFGGVAGGGVSAVGWDLWDTGALTVSGPGQVTVQINSLTISNTPGALANFNNNNNYQWLIATSSNGAFTSALSNNLITYNPTNFTNFNSIAGHVGFSLTSDGNNLYLNYTGNTVTAVPEPSSLVLVGFGILPLAWRKWRRRKQQAAAAETQS